MPLLNIDRLIKLGEVERILSQIFYPAPSRPTIVAWLEEGVLDGRQIGRGEHHYIYESSLNNLIRAHQPNQQKLAA